MAAEDSSEKLANDLRREVLRLGTTAAGGLDWMRVEALAERLESYANRVLALPGVTDVAKYKGSYETERLLTGALQARLNKIRAGVTKLEMARSDQPHMELYPLLTALAEFVETVEGALNG